MMVEQGIGHTGGVWKRQSETESSEIILSKSKRIDHDGIDLLDCIKKLYY